MLDDMKYVKLIAKPDTWYKVGTEVFYDDSSIKEPDVPIKRLTKEEFEKRSKEWDFGLMVGLHTPTEDYETKLFGTDEESKHPHKYFIETYEQPEAGTAHEVFA